MGIRPNSQNARIIKALADGRWHSVSNIHLRAGTSRLNSRISELRSKHGFEIEHEKIPGKKGAVGHRYRLLNPPDLDLVSSLVSTDRYEDAIDRDSVPRNQENRYRVYRMYYGDLELVATAENHANLGDVITSLGGKGVFNGTSIGVLDTRGTDETSGSWIINPWWTHERGK